MNVTEILDGVLAREGGYVEHPADRGHCTNLGITRQTLEDWRGRPVTCAEVASLSRAEAIEIYRELYVRRPGFDAVEDGRLLELLVDYGVHSGPRTAIRALQRALGVAPDGRIGPVTIAAIRAADASRIYRIVLHDRAVYLADILRRDPTQRAFASGWFRRIADFV